MELEFSSSVLLTLSLLTVLFMVLTLRKRSHNDGRTTANLPPGPWKLPIIGNLHQLVGSDQPHHRLRDLSEKYGPLMHLQLGQIPTVVVSSPEFAKVVMKTHDRIFASRPYNPVINLMTYNSTDIAFAPYGEHWRQLRKICMVEVLSTKRVQSFRSIREEEVTNLISSIASKAGSPINLSDQISWFSSSVVSRAAFGKKCKDNDTYASILREVLKLAGGFSIVELFPSIEGLLQWISGIKAQLEKMHRETDRILENIINEHKQELGKNGKNEDLVDVLLKIQEDGDIQMRLTTDNIKAVIWDIFSAGIETSSTTVDWAMSELMRNPTIMKRAQAEVREVFNRIGKVDEICIEEMKFLKLVIKETMRLHPALPLLIPRESRERCEISGFEIPTNTRLIVNTWAIGRDPDYWSEPGSFIPERFQDSDVDYKGTNFEYIPFGSGRRICPGISFGLANVEILFARLLYHFDWKLPNEMKHEDLDMTEEFSLAVKRRDNLWAIPISYNPSLGA